MRRLWQWYWGWKKKMMMIKMCNRIIEGLILRTFTSYSWLACDVIIFQNPQLKSHQSFYPHQALDGENWHLFTTFQLSSLLRLETRAFWNFSIPLFLAYSEDKVSGKALMYILVCSVQITSRLNSWSKTQMFTLLSGRHVGVPKWHTNMAAPYWAL